MNKYLAIFAVWVAGLLVCAFFVASHKSKQCAATVESIRLAQQAALSDALTAARFKDAQAAQQSAALLIKYEEAKNALNTQAIDNRRLVRERGGMRDPGASGAACAGVPTNPVAAASAANQTNTARLSDEATEFLLSEAERADQCAAALTAAHDYAVQINNAAK